MSKLEYGCLIINNNIILLKLEQLVQSKYNQKNTDIDRIDIEQIKTRQSQRYQLNNNLGYIINKYRMKYWNILTH